MSELVFEVIHGGFVAESLGENIVTQADTWEELRDNVREAVCGYFFNETSARPPRLRLHFVREVALAFP